MPKPVLEVEARLEDFITKQMKTIESNFQNFQNKLVQGNNQTGKSASLMAGQFNQAKQGLASFAAGFAPAALAVAGVYTAYNSFKNLLSSSLQEYKNQINAEARLESALGRTSTTLIKQSEELQKYTIYGDDAVLTAQSMIAAFIKDESVIKRLIPIVADFAAAKQIDLVSASELVTKAINGEINTLSRYGIKIEGAAGSTERVESAMKGLSKMSIGMAEALAKTDVGKLTVMENRLSDIKETLGKELIPYTIEWNKQLLEVVNLTTNIIKGISILGKFYSGNLNIEKERTLNYIKQLEVSGNKAELDKIAIENAEKIKNIDSAILKKQNELMTERKNKTDTWWAGEVSANDGFIARTTILEDQLKVLNKQKVKYEEIRDAASKTLTPIPKNLIAAIQRQGEEKYAPAPVKTDEELAKLKELQDRKLEITRQFNTVIYGEDNAAYMLKMEEYNKMLKDFPEMETQINALKQAAREEYMYKEIEAYQEQREKLKTIHEQQYTDLKNYWDNVYAEAAEAEANNKRFTENKLLQEKQLRDNIWDVNYRLQSSLMTLTEIGVQHSKMAAKKKRDILYAMAIADAAAAAVKGVYAVWSDDSIKNVYVKIAATAVVLAEIIASTATQISSIKKASFALGTNYAPGGQALVGEQGMEIVTGPKVGYLPRGSQVINNRDTMKMLGGNSVTFNVNIPEGAVVDRDAAEMILTRVDRIKNDLIYAQSNGLLNLNRIAQLG